MSHAATPTHAIPPANPSCPAGRYDIYRTIHKGLRAFMSDTLRRVGALDLEDAGESRQVLGQVRDLAVFCNNHLRHEDAFLHPALEARQPGAADRAAGDHAHHLQDIEKLAVLADEVGRASGSARLAGLLELQQHLALFVADSLEHMHMEETCNNTVLWACYTDAEIMGIEQAIVASLDPDDFGMCMRWILIGSNPTERAELLDGIRQGAPEPVFATVMDMARAHLSPRDVGKLELALGLREPLAA
jgi:hypothetical protein